MAIIEFTVHTGRRAAFWKWLSCSTRLGQVYAAFGDGALCRLTWLNPEIGQDLRLPGHDAEVQRVEQLLAFPERGWSGRIVLSGTEFQCRVWQALTKIPPGTTVSYRDIAQAIGQPRASRAVANACAANPVPVAVPCHRVIQADGRLGGYRYGLDKKIALLGSEGLMFAREVSLTSRPLIE